MYGEGYISNAKESIIKGPMDSPKKTPIEECLKELIESIRSLNIQIDMLTGKLGPIIMPDMKDSKCECCNDIPSPPKCELVSHIESQTLDIKYAINRLNDLRDRCCL